MAIPTRQLLPLPTVSTITSRGKSKIYSEVKDGLFPPPVRDGASSRWLSDEVQAWVDNLIAKPDATDADRRAFVADLVSKRPAPQARAA